MEKKGKICVFGASSDRLENTFTETAYELGTLMAERGWDCVNGAGSAGLMRAVSDGVLDAGGHVTGVIPQFMVDNGWQYSRLPQLEITTDMHTRKERMVQLADAFIVLPGGCGTIEEAMEIYTWRQLGIINKPIILLSTVGFYKPLVEMIDRCGTLGFMQRSHTRLWKVARTPKDALDKLERELREGIQPVEEMRDVTHGEE
ncbi:MAG: TIGR00730 family Rossman fold protein [Bacteroidales bacterium]|nr:TIGR00730 family Rossman fold protein [Bacteroidales bacterium]